MRPLVAERQGGPIPLRYSVQGLFRGLFRFEHHVPGHAWATGGVSEASGGGNEPRLFGDEVRPGNGLEVKHSQAEAGSKTCVRGANASNKGGQQRGYLAVFTCTGNGERGV